MIKTHYLGKFILFLGDMSLFYISLFITLFLRYGTIPTQTIIEVHKLPMNWLYLIWILVFYIAGLYDIEKFISFVELRKQIFKTMTVVGIISVVIFYTIPFWEITPKTILVINLLVATLLIWIWRKLFLISIIKREKIKVLFFGSSKEVTDFAELIKSRPQLPYRVVEIMPEEREINIKEYVLKNNIGIIVASDELKEGNSRFVDMFYKIIPFGITVVDFSKFYEAITGKVPISVISQSWFLDNISPTSHLSYDFFKRVMDITIAFILGLASLVFYPFVFVAMKLEGANSIFTFQDRIGKSNKLVRLVKFRSMTEDDKGKWGNENNNRVTRVGRFLRKWRIDELPQLWNVILGDISLIGPRPEFPEPVEHYVEKIPYYNMRHIIKPGLSGWAQLYHEEHPHHGTDVKQTENKLSHDLYYIKNRSLGLDLVIALKTIKIILSRQGR